MGDDSRIKQKLCSIEMNALLVDCYVVNILYIFDVLVYICFHLVTGEDVYRRSLLSNHFHLNQ